MDLLSAKKLSQHIDLSPFTIRRLGYAGKIKEYRCGKAVRYSLEEVVAWMGVQGETASPASNGTHCGTRKG